VLLGVALVTLAVPASAGAAARTSLLLPGITYTREVRYISGGPLVLHILRGPKPGGLYALRPVLSNGLVTGVERVSAMQRRLSGYATLAGVNADLFRWSTGQPSGMFMQEGRLAVSPKTQRSSLAIGTDGLLRIDTIRSGGAWQAEGFEAHPVAQLNRMFDTTSIGLFTPVWGPRTPADPLAVEGVLTDVPRIVPNQEMTVRVYTRRRGGGRPIPAGGAVLQAKGFWGDVLRRELPLGGLIRLHVGLEPWQTGLRGALGGGPLLVRAGEPVLRTDEEFTWEQLVPRHPRTAVGQLADGRIILVVADGRYAGSVGLRNWELALQMARLGAVRAMAFDSGSSSTMAFNGRLLNRPSDGSERAVADALALFYYGVYVPPLRTTVLSPNGDGINDEQTLAAKIVRPSFVDARLIRPNGTLAWHIRQQRAPGPLRKQVGPLVRMEGRWVWAVEAVDGAARTSRMVRAFKVNNTLGFLRFSTSRMRVVPLRGGRLVISFDLTNKSDLAIIVRNSSGRVIRHLARKADVPPARIAVVWNGKRDDGRVVESGYFRVRVTAVNPLGSVSLERRVYVWRDD
jgi:hypothetical protein